MGEAGRALRWFLGLRPQRLFDVLWFAVSATVTAIMGILLGRAVAISGGIPAWLARDKGMVYFAGSYAFGLVWAAWYDSRTKRLQPAWEAAVGAAIIWAFSPGYFVASLGIAAIAGFCKAVQWSRLLFDRRFAARYWNFVECRRARREGFIRVRAGPCDRRSSEPDLDGSPVP